MDLLQSECGTLPRLGALLDYFELIKDPRQPHWVAYPLAELLLLAVCGTIVDCSTRRGEMADWGSATQEITDLRSSTQLVLPTVAALPLPNTARASHQRRPG